MKMIRRLFIMSAAPATRGDSYCGSYNIHSFLETIHRYRFFSTSFSIGYTSGSMVANKIGHAYLLDQVQGLGLQMISANGGRIWKNLDTNMLKFKCAVRPPVPPDPPRVNFAAWAKWIIGSILSFVLPFWKQKWEKLKRIEGEVEIVMEEVENVAAVVQKVAEMAETVSAEIAEKLPDKGKLKETALLIERFSEATAYDAQLTKDFIHKIDELKHDFEDLETVVEPVTKKLMQQKSERK